MGRDVVFRVPLNHTLVAALVEATGHDHGRDLTDPTACGEALAELIECDLYNRVSADCHDEVLRDLIRRELRKLGRFPVA